MLPLTELVITEVVQTMRKKKILLPFFGISIHRLSVLLFVCFFFS